MAVLLPAPTTVPPTNQETLNFSSDPLASALASLVLELQVHAATPPHTHTDTVCAALKVEPGFVHAE